MLENTYRTIMKNCKVGSGICTNVMFLNPFQWGFQYPLIMKLRSQVTI
jgi:enoyl reductase-like protein